MAEMSHLKPAGRDHKWESTNDCEEYQVKRQPQKVFENSLFFFLLNVYIGNIFFQDILTQFFKLKGMTKNV